MGVFPDHFPLKRQMREILPSTKYPGIHLYMALDINVVPVYSTVPNAMGSGGLPQSTAGQRKTCVVDNIHGTVAPNYCIHKYVKS